MIATIMPEWALFCRFMKVKRIMEFYAWNKKYYPNDSIYTNYTLLRQLKKDLKL